MMGLLLFMISSGAAVFSLVDFLQSGNVPSLLACLLNLFAMRVQVWSRRKQQITRQFEQDRLDDMDMKAFGRKLGKL